MFKRGYLLLSPIRSEPEPDHKNEGQKKYAVQVGVRTLIFVDHAHVTYRRLTDDMFLSDVKVLTLHLILMVSVNRSHTKHLLCFSLNHSMMLGQHC